MFQFLVNAEGGLTSAGYAVCIAAGILLFVIAIIFAGKGSEKKKMTAKQLAFCAMAMALAMVTSMVKLIDMPMGGSVTLCSMFFVCLIGYIYGLRTGLMAAIAYGFLQLVVDPYIISIPQMFTDYIFGFGALGLSGIFSGKKNGMLIGYLAGALGRYFFTFLSGMIFFGSNGAAYHMSAPVYSLAYNGAYLVPEAVVTVIIILMPPVNKALLKVKAMAN